ncbi:nuclear transport factor 2 family protein [Nocardioides immobilis]|uniref:Nuclear transport factor 2 family protein n=1 Tax=Nocardioides immobilis TaxID=2049295 RepID=A0A417Y0A6_9ACTN|nr:nuclear transport factor 2 family protein [Nocardioides immobilis]RHW26069.1 nuclear transport factor 2 family protein [Nocardioides immobilis]
MHPFRKAVEAADVDAMSALLADDVVFTSPVAFKPYEGKPITAAILANVVEVFEDFRYVREYDEDGASGHALMFEAKVDGKAITGCDFVRTNADGLIDDLMVMVRPLSAAQALSAAMGARFDDIVRRASGG